MDQRLDLEDDTRRGARTRKAKRDAINAKNLAKFGGPIQALYSQRSEYDSLCCFPPPYTMDLHAPDTWTASSVANAPKGAFSYITPTLCIIIIDSFRPLLLVQNIRDPERIVFLLRDPEGIVFLLCKWVTFS